MELLEKFPKNLQNIVRSRRADLEKYSWLMVVEQNYENIRFESTFSTFRVRISEKLKDFSRKMKSKSSF